MSILEVVVSHWPWLLVISSKLVWPTTYDQRRFLTQFPVFSSRFSVPADRVLVQVDVDLFGFQIFFDSPGAQLASEAGLLVSAPRRLHVRGLHVIDPDNAGAQRLYGAEGFEDVASPDRRCETVGRIVGDFHRVFFVFERDQRGHGPENLFAGDAGAVVEIIENRGFDVIALGEFLGASAAGCKFAFFF